MAFTTIDDPSAHFQIKKWTGNASTNAITLDGNSNMQPDWMWHKQPEATNGWHQFDSSQGVTKYLATNGNAAAGTYSNYLTSFDSNGFTVPSGDTSMNANNTYQCSWLWKANGGSTTSVSESGSGNGGINACTYQANTTAGFSIIKYTGHRGSGIGDNNHTNVTHGLSSAPNFVIIKNLSISSNWIVGGDHIGEYSGPFANRHMKINDTAARDGGDYVFNTAADSNYVYVGNNNEVNGDGNSIIMYAFHDVTGYSKFGSYTGNATIPNGPFVYTGFKPSLVLLKNMDATEPWILIDTTRDTNGNVMTRKMGIHSTDIEDGVSGQGDANYNKIDILSNGFKCRSNNGASNGSGNTFMYMAFAEEPLVTSGGVPATAR